ncbi:MAG: hypothetical protein QOD99_77 [Chthoniobacter sp.]|nr:hypothetical protein [Chthoniobacter sp.]
MTEPPNPSTLFIRSRGGWHGDIALFLLLACACGVAALSHADTVVFNDTFGGGSTINNATPSPTPAINKTAYQQISAKAFASPTSVAAGHMKYGLPATTSAVNMIEALFTQYPVVLTGSNDSIQTTFTFTPQAAMLDSTGGGLFFGVYNAAQVQPVPGGLNGTVGTGTAGSAQNWQGYANRIMIGSGVTTGIFTRPAQTAAAANNQDVCYSYASGVTLNSIANPVISLSASTQYTGVFTVTKTSDTALTITSNLYQGGDASGAQIFTETGTATGIVSGTFDALALGFRATGTTGGTHIQIMDVNNVKVTTTASTTVVPVITQQPVSQTRQVGDNVIFNVTASGGGAALSYQWFKGLNPISSGSNATAITSSLALNNVSQSDADSYYVVVTDAAGSTQSTTATLTVSIGAIAPSILQDPSSATILVGGSATFTAQFAGTAPVTAQWQKSTNNGGSYNGVGSSTSSSPTSYTVTNAQFSDAGLYLLSATNAQGSVTSGTATLTVQMPAAIVTSATSAVLNPGNSYSLVASGTGAPAPSFQWYRNSVVVPGATNSTLSLPNVSGSNTGNYYVVASNVTVSGSGSGNVTNTGTSSIASVVVLAPSMTPVSFGPVNGATGINPDALLKITFNQAVSVGVSGRIRVYDASNPATPVDTIDMSTAHYLAMTKNSAVIASGFFMQKTIGDLIYNYMPVIVSGNSATIALHSSTKLTYGKTYYVNIEPGVLVDSTGASFAGISDNTTGVFSTKSSGPAAGATAITVAADGTGDFNTVQGAIDFVPFSPANTIPRTITVKNGTYTELVHLRGGQNLITLQGQSRDGTVIGYLNNNTVLNDMVTQNTLAVRGSFSSNANDFTLYNLSIKNLTPEFGSQAEALVINGPRAIVNHVSLYSYQDTLLMNSGSGFFTDCYIEGAVDYMWGGAATFFQRCELKANGNTSAGDGTYYTQARNAAPTGNVASKGFSYVNCTLDAYPSNTSATLSRTFNDYSQTIYINCKMGPHITSTGWNINSGNTATLALWEFNSMDLNGNPLNVSGRPTYNRAFAVSGTSIIYTAGSTSTDVLDHQQVSAGMAALFSTPSAFFYGAWAPTVAPTIDTQPASQTVNPGQAVTFTVAATGAPDPTYQWYKNNALINSATNASYSIASASGTNWGNYTVNAINTSGTATSNVATLSFNDPEANFAASYGLDPATNGAPAADPDLDGMNNKLEFLLGGNPTHADDDSILPVSHYLTGATPALVFEFNANIQASYTVEYSTDLKTWTTAVNGQNGVTVTSNHLDPNRDHVTVTIPAPASPKVFARLRL